MNKRDALLNLIHGDASPDYTPAAFFYALRPFLPTGQAAVDKRFWSISVRRAWTS